MLFVAAAALNGADFAVTRASLQSGGQELNPVVRMFGLSAPGLAGNFVGEAAGGISLSYFLRKTITNWSAPFPWSTLEAPRAQSVSGSRR